MLAFRRSGAGPTVVALHGFTHTGAQFDGLASGIGRTVIAPDLPGHGHSKDAPSTLPSVVAQVAETLVAVHTGAVPIVGYSQGGRVALLVADARPDLVSGLALISTTAGIADPVARAARAQADRKLASHIVEAGIEGFLDGWTRSGITSTTHLEAGARQADLDIRMENTAAGLAAAVEGYGQGAQPSLWDSLASITVPVVLITGSEDPVYTAHAEAMARRLPDATVEVLEGARHNPLLDTPDLLTAAISGFLDRLG
ncbi:MAG TPA: alpha/beta fold hydrolase [Acidimicrobiia bacterium]|nr:alpha/beta fold hydrolase [Acidimicrobiia bacterium]